MAGSKETVYIKADRNVEVTDPCVKLGDILSMECANPTVLPKLKTIKLLRFHGVDKKTQNRVAVSILKVIECIHAEYPEISWNIRPLNCIFDFFADFVIIYTV